MSQIQAGEIEMYREGSSGGMMHIPADSGSGGVGRPYIFGDKSSYTGTFETLFDYWIDSVPDPESLELDPGFRSLVRMHPDVVGCMTQRSLAVANFPMRIDAAKGRYVDPDVSQIIADYVQDVFDGLPRREEFYRTFEDAVIDGGVGFEFRYEQRTGFGRPVDWQPRDKSRFVFNRQGKLGLLTREVPVWGGYVDTPSVKLPISGEVFTEALQGKFLYHRYHTGYGTWYRTFEEGYQYWGRGLNLSLYNPVTFDYFVLRSRLKWIEKYGIPPTDIYYAENRSDGLAQLNAIAATIHNNQVSYIPRPAGTGSGDNSEDWFRISQRDVPATSYDAHQSFNESWVTPSIEKIILGAADQLKHGDRGGFSDHVSRKDAGPQVVFGYDARMIDCTINEGLVPSIVQQRFGMVPPEYMPKHKLEPEPEKDQKQRVDVLTTVSMHVPVREQDWYEAGGIVAPGPMDKVVTSPQQGQDDGSGFGMGGMPPMNPGKPTQSGQQPHKGIGQGGEQNAKPNQPPRENDGKQVPNPDRA